MTASDQNHPLLPLGWSGHFADALAAMGDEALVPARVMEVQKGLSRVSDGVQEWEAEAAGSLRRLPEAESGGRPAVGDFAACQGVGGPMVAILPRKSLFSRRAAGTHAIEQVIAANIDTVLLVMGLDGDYNHRRIERYLAVGWESGATPVVVLTKADLCPEVEERLAAIRAIAGEATVHAISVFDEIGLAELDQYLRPAETLALLGSSGVGKSTLLNYLMGAHVQKTQAARAGDSRGRHTTTHRELFTLPSGALIIDSPGMRELQLWETFTGLGQAFADITALSAECKYADCTHLTEPDCAVLAAVETGVLDRERFESYCKLIREQAHLVRQVDKQAASNAKKRWKTIHKEMRHHPKYKDR